MREGFPNTNNKKKTEEPTKRYQKPVQKWLCALLLAWVFELDSLTQNKYPHKSGYQSVGIHFSRFWKKNPYGEEIRCWAFSKMLITHTHCPGGEGLTAPLTTLCHQPLREKKNSETPNHVARGKAVKVPNNFDLRQRTTWKMMHLWGESGGGKSKKKSSKLPQRSAVCQIEAL